MLVFLSYLQCTAPELDYRSIHTAREVYLQNKTSRALEIPKKQCGKRGLDTEHSRIQSIE